MLVLTRKKDEAILIDDDIKVVVVEVREHQVKLGISAPPGRSIHREEVYLKIQNENRAASLVSAVDILTREREEERR
ncbi:MAG: carbon storage regulator CsrA [Thermodesulfobacteriota bacterium]